MKAGAEWPPWWAGEGVLQAFISDLVADEVARLRPGAAALPPLPWVPDMALDGPGLGLDSLERLSVAAALAEALHLQESGLSDLLLARRRLDEWVALAGESLAEFSTRIGFRTSGSSGAPKLCVHALAHLQQEVEHLATLWQPTSGHAPPRRLLLAVPRHHIYGFLFGVLLPLRLGCPVLDIRGHSPAALGARLQPGDLLISHPAHWALVTRHAGALPAGVQGVSSTAPCPDDLAEALRAQGLARLIQVYGSSETAGIGWRETAGAAYRLMPHWRRDATDPTQLLRHAADGSVHAHALQDRLDWQDGAAAQFRVAGRLDAAVQVAGINVFPQRVRAVLTSHPDVADAAVRLMSAGEGERLKAFIVPRPGADGAALAQALPQWAQQQLQAPELPRAWRFGASLPVNERGKACDWPAHGGEAWAADALALQNG